MTKKLESRRAVLKKAIIVSGIFLGAKAVSANDILSCGVTPPQTEGPFYPRSFGLDQDNDLTFVKATFGQALGEVVFIRGIVQDEACRPIKGAIIEIWQACHTGKYNHPSDPNPAKLDPEFQYYGRATSNEKGEYVFKTIIPGEYQANESWRRPPHIHVKVQLRGYTELTTQMYFKGHALNKEDKILKSLSIDDQRKVVIDFKKDSNGLKIGQFNLSLVSF